jgi:hypothetical protein
MDVKPGQRTNAFNVHMDTPSIKRESAAKSVTYAANLIKPKESVNPAIRVIA